MFRSTWTETCSSEYKSKGIPRQAEVALGGPGRLRPRIISTFGTTRVVGRQPYSPVAFTLGEIAGTHFLRLSRPQGTWFCQKEPRKKSSDITGNRSWDRPTSSATVAIYIFCINAKFASPKCRVRYRLI